MTEKKLFDGKVEEDNDSETVFNSWHIGRLIGEGSFGKVFEIERQGCGETCKAALKIITVPRNENELLSLLEDGIDEDSIDGYLMSLVNDIVSHYALASKFKGSDNIVSCDEFQIIPHKGKTGWDILIRMELLIPLTDHIQALEKPFSRKEVIRLGIDICSALELCQKYSVIHRDIKPENIFVTQDHRFKLGDFGVACTFEDTGMVRQGAMSYMAPEIYKGESYGAEVDIYSLGIVMYRLLNNNRLPFLPKHPSNITFRDREEAIKKRLTGEVFPNPVNADTTLTKVVLKACEYKPENRYSSPVQMREELETIANESNVDDRYSRVVKALPDEMTESIKFEEMDPYSRTVYEAPGFTPKTV